MDEFYIIGNVNKTEESKKNYNKFFYAGIVLTERDFIIRLKIYRFSKKNIIYFSCLRCG